MPILGHEQPVLFSMDEVFNPTTANMLLQALLNYGNILRLDYKESVLDFKDFNREFGNFYSAIAADNQRYYDLTLGGLGNLYDAMLKQGVDPLRSVEGRAMLLKYIATRPYGELANIKRSADAAKEYIKNRDALIALGLYNPEFDKFIYGEGDPTSWNTAEQGIWSRTSPEQYKDLNSSTRHWFDNMELSYDEAASKATGGKYDIYSKSEGTMRSILDTKLKDYLSTNLGKFHLLQYGGNKEALKNAIVDANREVIQQKRSMNEEYAMNRKFAHDFAMEGLQYRHNLNILNIKSGGNGKNNKTGINLFEAAYQNEKNKKGGVTYMPGEIKQNGIIPDQLGWSISVGKVQGKDVGLLTWNKSDEKPTLYKIKKIYTKDKSGKIRERKQITEVKLSPEFEIEYNAFGKEIGRTNNGITATNGGVMQYLNSKKFGPAYYNLIFIDTDNGEEEYWMKTNYGSMIKPGETGIPYNENNL